MPTVKTLPYEVKAETQAGETVTVCTIDRNTKEGKYTFKPEVPQGQYVGEIKLIGFTSLPAGLKRSGAGFTANAYLVLKSLSEHLGTFELTISAKEPTSVKKKGKKSHVILSHSDLRTIQSALLKIGAEKFNEQKTTVHAYLKSLFPKDFPELLSDPLLYKTGNIADQLKKKDILKHLNKNDVETLTAFIPNFLKAFGDQLAGAGKLIALSKSKRSFEVLYLDRIVKLFQDKLKKRLSENKWQEFLRDYILIFNSNYARSLEKESLSLNGSNPDFILIDAYNFLDIYEIKMPTTPLLLFDKSHKTFYWSAELSKALAQTEGYLAHAEQTGLLVKETLRVQKGEEVRVLKPRGFVIAGSRKQLKGEAMENGFRILNDGLKNIQVILYDDLFSNLKNFLSRIKEGSKKKKRRPAKLERKKVG